MAACLLALAGGTALALMAPWLAATLLALALVAGVSPALAETKAPPDDRWSSPAALGLGGTLIYKNFSHFEESPNDDQLIRNEGLLRLEGRWRPASWSRLEIVGEARADDAGLARGVRLQIPDTSRFRSLLDLKEAIAGFQYGPLDLTLGKQIFAWGTADAFNPTDNLNPYDFLDVIDHEKMGVYAAAARASVGPVTLTFVAVPYFTPSRTPLRDSRWLPLLSPEASAILAERELPGPTVDNIQYAARLRGTIRGWDLSVSYFDGFEHTPVIKQTSVEVSPGTVAPRLTPVFTRMGVAGFDFSTTWRSFEFHGEGAVKLVKENGRVDRFQGVIGLNYAWDSRLRWLERINVILEYGREEDLASDPDSPVLSTDRLLELGALLLNNAARDGVFGQIRFTFDDATQLTLRSAVDFTVDASSYAQIKVNRKLLRSLHLEAGLDVFSGDRDTFWGRWRDNNRFFLFLKYFF